MQTFMPFADFKKSAKCLDRLRLGKQRVECLQIVKALIGESKGWTNHPATKMWKENIPALCSYWQAIIDEWTSRGYVDNTHKELARLIDEYGIDKMDSSMPSWFGNEKFHLSHKSNLLRKNREHYIQYFNVSPELEYIWP